MELRLSESERDRMRAMVRRPRSRKQLYRAESLLELDAGRPAEAVARRHRVGVERVESWVARFLERRMAFLAEPDAGRPRRNDEDRDEEN